MSAAEDSPELVCQNGWVGGIPFAVDASAVKRVQSGILINPSLFFQCPLENLGKIVRFPYPNPKLCKEKYIELRMYIIRATKLPVQTS